MGGERGGIIWHGHALVKEAQNATAASRAMVSQSQITIQASYDRVEAMQRQQQKGITPWHKFERER